MTFTRDAARGTEAREPGDAEGAEMLRATVWTVGLFGAGTAISRVLPGTWTEPIILFALGLALLFVSARTSRGTAARERAVSVPKVAPKPVAAPATARVQVERTA